MKNIKFSNETKKIIEQAFKEFRYPLSLATIWLGFNIYSNYQSQNTLDIIKILNTFFATFFFISWGFAQYFRIKKQNKVESSFNTIENKTTDIITRLETATTELIGNITGGESIVYLLINENGSSRFYHHGKHTFQGGSLRIVDLEKFDKLTKVNPHEYTLANDSFHQIPALIPFYTIPGPAFDIKNRSRLDYNIFYRSRNGAFVQELRMLKINDKWEYATRISFEIGKELHQEISDNFPKNKAGEVEWNKNHE